MNTELSTIIDEGGASGSNNRNSERIDKKYPNNQLIFVGKGNPAPSKYIIIPKDLENEVEDFTNNYLVRGIENIDPELPAEGGSSFLPTKPGVLISVTGGAADFYMQPSKLEQVFNRGMLKAAQNIGAWIVDGGLDVGVMLYVGKAIKETAVVDVPCIGIASHKKVIMNELLLEKGKETVPAEYVANQPNSRDYCALNANHTHFILVDSPDPVWGQEIKFRSEFEKFIRDKYHVPVVLIVVNGGGGTMETVAQGAEKHFAVVVVQGSGRASDAVAAMVKKAQKAKVVHTCDSLLAITDDGVDVTPWHNLLREAQGPKRQESINTWTGYMNRILQNYEAVTVFNCDDEAASDMDIYILRAILSSPGRKLSLLEKLKLGVVWNRADIVSEILEDSENDGDLTSEDKRTALNSAFELAIQYDRPEIFKILAENGAQKDSVNLKKLYYFKELKSYFKRLPAYAQTRRVSSKELASPSLRLPLPIDINTDSSTEYSKDSAKNRAMLRETFRQIGHAFHGYYAAFEKKFDSNEDIDQRPGTATMHRRNKKLTYKESGVRVSFTDILIWSVFVNRMDLAKVIWQHTTLPVHSALLACQLYRYLANYCSNKEDYQTNADWFEDEAIKMLDIMDYQDVKEVLIWEWSEMGNRSALDIAQTAQCKRFVCHAHVQSLLDDIFYSDQYGKLEPTIPTYRIWAAIIMPLFISLIYKNMDTSPQKAFYMFYRLPIVKFWTNTFLYCAFLFVQAFVLCTLKEGDAFHVTEYILWVWVFSLIIDEISQYVKDPLNHFKYLSNLMDVLVLLLHVVYMVLRWVAYAKQDDNKEGTDEKTTIFSGSINTLIVACIFSWARLLNAFAISHNLGPLYFIIIRLFKDIFVWIFVFVIFAVSFQLGFISMTLQLNGDPVEGYPTGTFPVAFFTIIGEYSYSADFLSGTPLGITLLAIYALIAQILLVNLLIAMMGSTYSNVSENSATEWKFFRLELMMENRSASFHPPPTNIIIVPLEFIFGARKLCDNRNGSGDMKPLVAGDDSNVGVKDIAHTNFDLQKILKKMRIAKDEVIETEQQASATSVLAIVGNVHDRLRTLANERENDRTFLDKKFADLGTTLTVAANQAAASGGGGAVAGLALGKLQDTIQVLNSTNQLLVQQNQQILAQLVDLQNRQQQMQVQIASLQAPQSGPSGEGRARLESSANRMRATSRRNTEADPSDDNDNEGRVVL